MLMGTEILMKTIKVNDLKPGIAFTEDVFIDGDSLLVPARISLKEKDLSRIINWGFEEVQTDGVEYKQESGEKTVSKPGKSSDVEKIRSCYNTTVINLMTLFIAFEGNKKVVKKTFEDLLAMILPRVIEDPEGWLNHALEVKREDSSLAQGAVNSMIYAVVIAGKIGLKSDDLDNLAMAALIHDIGMLKIPDSIKDKQGKLSSQELEKIKTHTIYSYRFITSELDLNDSIGKTALLHHERWDGKGYPRQLAKKQIPLTARILSVSDAFEAMVRDKPYRESMIGYTAVRQILNDNSRRFDADIIKVFIKSMGIYPVGSYVILNDGAVGVVSKIHAEAPLRPVIRLLLNSSGKKVENESISLLENKESFIAKPFNPKDIKKKQG